MPKERNAFFFFFKLPIFLFSRSHTQINDTHTHAHETKGQVHVRVADTGGKELLGASAESSRKFVSGSLDLHPFRISWTPTPLRIQTHMRLVFQCNKSQCAHGSSHFLTSFVLDAFSRQYARRRFTHTKSFGDGRMRTQSWAMR